MTKPHAESKRRRLRLLPITVTMLSLLCLMRVNELYWDSQPLRDLYSARDAHASGKKEPEAKKPEAEAAHETPKESEKTAAAEEHKKEEGGHGEAKEASGGHGESSKPVEEPKTFGTGKSTVKEIEAMKARDAQPRFTKNEIDILENLSKRREALDAREKELDLKAQVLEAGEKRMKDKITEMKTLQAELSKVVAQYNEKQDAQIKSLVKIYEGMKPDEAAAIFNELEMPILLDVISKMSERKVALVLANMNPKRARDVTQELAERRKKTALPDSAVK